MLSLRRSTTSSFNASFVSTPRKNRSNASYVEAYSPEADHVALLLLGGKGPVDFRLRVAQSHARDDMAPSAWSHVAILGPRVNNPLRRVLYEVPLSGRFGLGYPPASNGVIQTPLAEYDDPALYPNIAVLDVPIPMASVKQAIARFRTQRAVMDALELSLAWLAFAWGVGSTGNPLLAGLGVPSAAFVEYVLGAAGYDLVPGFPSRSSCPEAIWQSARWWHEVARLAPSVDRDAHGPLPPIAGVYDAEHYLLEPPVAPARGRRR